MRRAGFTLIELTIVVAIGALIAVIAVMGVNAVTSAHVRSAAVELTGAIKMSYDRAIMEKRTQRIVMDIDTGTWWLEFSDDPFALSKDRVEGREGAKAAEGEDKDDEDSIFGSRFADEVDEAVKSAIEGGAAANFQKDADLDAGQPTPLPSGTCFSRIWTGHQEEPFESGLAYLHFFAGGWTEPASIELVETECSERVKPESDDDNTYITLELMPLTGRARSYHRKMDRPTLEEWDGREEGDE